MQRKWMLVLVLAFFAVSLTGCAGGRKKKDLEMQGLRNQVSVLESQTQSKDEEITSLKAELTKIQEEAEAHKAVGEVKARPNAKQIQIALESAGFNPGPIDGKMGKGTREAIKAFQKANNLPVDGRVGKKTWILLSQFLYQKIK